MGTRYTINLYYPTEKLPSALETLNKLTEICCKNQVVVKLLDMSKVQVAHSDDFRDIGKKLSLDNDTKDKWLSFDISLPLPLADSTFREFLSGYGEIDPRFILSINNMQYKCFGQLSFIIELGNQYSSINFMTVASSQNKVMSHSNAMHTMMKKLLKDANGILGFIDTESGTDEIYDVLLLDNPNERYLIELPDSNEDIDHLVQAFITKLNAE
jgi:hypothetical protein